MLDHPINSEYHYHLDPTILTTFWLLCCFSQHCLFLGYCSSFLIHHFTLLCPREFMIWLSQRLCNNMRSRSHLLGTLKVFSSFSLTGRVSCYVCDLSLLISQNSETLFHTTLSCTKIPKKAQNAVYLIRPVPFVAHSSCVLYLVIFF